ncbi:MAG: hypothetical protein WBA16_09245 [Nonlabens sp.]
MIKLILGLEQFTSINSESFNDRYIKAYENYIDPILNPSIMASSYYYRCATLRLFGNYWFD